MKYDIIVESIAGKVFRFKTDSYTIDKKSGKLFYNFNDFRDSTVIDFITNVVVNDKIVFRAEYKENVIDNKKEIIELLNDKLKLETMGKDFDFYYMSEILNSLFNEHGTTQIIKKDGE